jgi:hypothetical protein
MRHLRNVRPKRVFAKLTHEIIMAVDHNQDFLDKLVVEAKLSWYFLNIVARHFVHNSSSCNGMDATAEVKNDHKIIARHFLNTSSSRCGMDVTKEWF